MNCPKCGNQLIENDKFCRNCGEPIIKENNEVNNQPINNYQNIEQPIQNQAINEVQMNQPMSETEISQQPSYQISENNSISNTEEENKSNRKTLILIISAVLLIGISIGLMLFLKPKNNNKTDDEDYEDIYDVDEDTDEEETDLTSGLGILNYTIPVSFKLEKTKYYIDGKYYIYKNINSSANFYSIGIASTTSVASEQELIDSLREGSQEQMKEELNNASDYVYTKGTTNYKQINNKKWTYITDTMSCASLGLKGESSFYIIKHNTDTYVIMTMVRGDISSVEPEYSNFINSLKFD